ncbi:hypothetical protein Hanom_Chr01g00006711 [Helianthus anomalus]
MLLSYYHSTLYVENHALTTCTLCFNSCPTHPNHLYRTLHRPGSLYPRCTLAYSSRSR